MGGQRPPESAELRNRRVGSRIASSCRSRHWLTSGALPNTANDVRAPPARTKRLAVFRNSLRSTSMPRPVVTRITRSLTGATATLCRSPGTPRTWALPVASRASGNSNPALTPPSWQARMMEAPSSLPSRNSAPPPSSSRASQTACAAAGDAGNRDREQHGCHSRHGVSSGSAVSAETVDGSAPSPASTARLPRRAVREGSGRGRPAGRAETRAGGHSWTPGGLADRREARRPRFPARGHRSMIHGFGRTALRPPGPNHGRSSPTPPSGAASTPSGCRTAPAAGSRSRPTAR